MLLVLQFTCTIFQNIWSSHSTLFERQIWVTFIPILISVKAHSKIANVPCVIQGMRENTKVLRRAFCLLFFVGTSSRSSAIDQHLLKTKDIDGFVNTPSKLFKVVIFSTSVFTKSVENFISDSFTPSLEDILPVPFHQQIWSWNKVCFSGSNQYWKDILFKSADLIVLNFVRIECVCVGKVSQSCG